MKEYSKELKVGQHIVQLSHQSKILFPKLKITKGKLIAYYHHIARVKDLWRDMKKKACALTQVRKKLRAFN